MIPKRLAETDQARFTHRWQAADAKVEAAVRRIIGDVQTRGDEALIDLTERLDKVRPKSLWLAPEAWQDVAGACPAEVRTAIDNNLARIRAFHELQRGQDQELETAPGLHLGRRAVPYLAVACYVPGGRASYPSTVLMTVVPAVIAGVRRIIVATPPRADGTVDPAVAYAARAAGATDILLVGGAQAIAALALGTESVPPVQAIVGPGNAYVTAAKHWAAQRVWTDAPAGPSELLVLASADADAHTIALDMIAQAEHDPDAQVILVTDDARLAAAVAETLPGLIGKAPRKDIIQASLTDHGAILVADSWDEAIRFSNDYAPEHLEIHSKDPRGDLLRIDNAGSVFLGTHTPVSLGDYGSGTNHVLPTMGLAAIRGGLGVDDFRRWQTWQEATPGALAAVANDIMTLADAEGLHGHAEAVRRRL